LGEPDAVCDADKGSAATTTLTAKELRAL